MLALLSPAKKLDLSAPFDASAVSQSDFLPHTQELVPVVKQLSTDDRMGASGMLMQSLVAQDLNINALMDVHHGQRVLRNGDVLLLCTDGLTDVLSDTEIEQALAQPGAADTLVLLALERGAPGNVSCVVAVVEDAAH